MPTPPSFDPRRRNARSGPLRLPAEGRVGDAPAWPLSPASDEESSAWSDLWHSPQAVAWERLGWFRTVARYCRVMVAAEQREAPAALLAQATSMEDRLGLTPKAMRLLLWEVVPDEVSEQRAAKPAAKRRLKAVDGDAVARSV